MYSQFCPDVLDESRTATFIPEEDAAGSPFVGCSVIGYKIRLYNAEEVPLSVAVVLSENSVPAGPWLTPAEVVNNGGFSWNGAVWSRTLSVEPFTEPELVITFKINENFPASNSQNRIRATVSATSDPVNCTPENVVFAPVFPVLPRYVVSGTEYLSDLAVGTDPLIPTGPLLTPQLSLSWGQQILISAHSQLVIDLPEYHFPLGSDILMGPVASLVIQQGNHHLRISNQSQVIGCLEMWDKIEVQNGATLTIEGIDPGVNPTGVLIKDAMTAIEAKSGSTVQVTRTTFRNNLTGIFTPANTFNDVNLTIHQNTFEVNELKPPLSFVESGLAGVRLNNILNVVTLNQNRYRNLYNGIYSSHSSLIVNHDRFEDILDAGILAESKGGHTLMQYGNGMNEAEPSFTNCLTGIRAVNMHITSEQNVMKDVTWGISLRDGKLKNAFIRDNIIRAERTGISINNWQPLSYNAGLIVDNNELKINGNKAEGAGIKAELLYGTNTSATNLHNNQISLGDARFGIWLNNTSKLGIHTNDILIENNHASQGISLSDAYRNALYCNYVKGTNTNAEQEGIYLETTSLNALNCNSTQFTERGIFFLGENMPTTLQGHQFHQHNRALQYGNGSVAGAQTGVQTHRGNRWMQTYQAPDFGVWHRGNEFQLNNSKIEYDPTDEPVPGQVQLRTSEEPTQVGSIGSIFEERLGNTYLCNSSVTNCPPTPNGFAGEGNAAGESIANGSYTAHGYYPDAQTWTAKRQLYRRLLDTPSLLVPGSSMASFFDAEAHTTVGRFELVRQQMEALLRPSEAVQAQMEANQEAIVARMQQVSGIESQLGTGLDAQQEAILKGQRQVLQSEIMAYETAQTALYQSENTARAAAAAQILAMNEGISAVMEYEQLQSKVNRVMLQSIIEDQEGFGDADLALLVSVANTCPFSGGQAVYQARAMLGNKLSYDDDALCQPSSPLRKPEGPEKPLVFTLYPNPSNGFVMVELAEAAKEEGFIELKDALGRQFHIARISTGEQTIPLIFDNLQPGIYYLTVRMAKRTATKILSNLR